MQLLRFKLGFWWKIHFKVGSYPANKTENSKNPRYKTQFTNQKLIHLYWHLEWNLPKCSLGTTCTENKNRSSLNVQSTLMMKHQVLNWTNSRTLVHLFELAQSAIILNPHSEKKFYATIDTEEANNRIVKYILFQYDI